MAGSTIKAGPLRWLVLSGCLINGLLAGENVYRYLIEVPAWRHLDRRTWAQYSLHADLGNGIFLFPAEAISGTAILVVAGIIALKNRNLPRLAAFAIYLSMLLSLAGIVLTFWAAPLMLSLKTNSGDLQRVQQVFDQFHFWGGIRAIAQILLFFTNLMAVALVYSINVNDKT